MKSFPWKNRCLTAFLWMTLLLLCGCRTVEEYQAEAVDRARVFLLENAKDLSPEEVSFVKFNDPVLFFSTIFTRDTSLQLDLKQICVAWPLTEKNEFYLVFGASSELMNDWYPIQAFRKKFVKESPPLVQATDAARAYMINALLQELSPREINHVRFLFPTVIRTNFVLTVDPDSDLTEEDIQETKERLQKATQYSLVWFPPGHDPIVFCGTGRRDLAGWRINFAGTMTSEKVRQHTLEVVKRQDQDTSSFLSREEIRKLNEREQKELQERQAAAKKVLQTTVQQHIQSNPKSGR